MRTLFHPLAPIPVRLGATLLLGAYVTMWVPWVARVWTDASTWPGPWRGLGQPLIGMAVVVMWTTGIARMRGMFYWSMFAMVAFTVVGLAGVTTARLLSGGVSGALVQPTAFRRTEIWLAMAGLTFLLFPVSVRAFWKHGRT